MQATVIRFTRLHSCIRKTVSKSYSQLDIRIMFKDLKLVVLPREKMFVRVAKPKCRLCLLV